MTIIDTNFDVTSDDITWQSYLRYLYDRGVRVCYSGKQFETSTVMREAEYEKLCDLLDRDVDLTSSFTSKAIDAGFPYKLAYDAFRNDFIDGLLHDMILKESQDARARMQASRSYIHDAHEAFLRGKDDGQDPYWNEEKQLDDVNRTRDMRGY